VHLQSSQSLLSFIATVIFYIQRHNRPVPV
jgi:hypothetical protein